MNRQSTTLSAVLLLLVANALAEEDASAPIQSSGAIRQVILYRDRALVTREISIPAGKKLHTVEVADLPERIVADSVFADGNEQTVVRAVRVSFRPATESNREGVRELDKQLEELNGQQAATQHALDVVTKNLDSLNQMASFAVTAGHSDLERGILNAESLTRVAIFSMDQRRGLSAEQFAAQRQLEVLAKQIQLVKSQRDQTTSVRRPAAHQAKIFVETADGVAAKIKLSYLVGGCAWSPQYTVRGRTGEPRFELRYCALIQQMSGEDWRDVNFVLSTASPAVIAARPLLTPLRIAIMDPSQNNLSVKPEERDSDPFDSSAGGGLASNTGNLSDTLPALHRSLRQQQHLAEVGLDDEQVDAPGQRNGELNSLAEKIQQIELQAESNSWRAIAPDVNDDLASQVYMLSQPISLDTRREQQLVVVLETQLAGEMYHVATPLLSTYVYREAEMTNSQPNGLLAGPATVYLDDRFVGRTQIPSTASGQSLTVGFGADQQIRTRRELLAKQDEIKGGNRHLNFSYRLVLANFKEKQIAVRLIERLPIALDTEQLSIQLDTPQVPLSADGLYQRLQRPTGILRWDLSIPANRHGSQAFDLQYSYTLEFDRNRVPTTQHLLADIKAEIEDRGNPSGMGGFGGGGFGGGGFGGGGLSGPGGAGRSH